MSKTQIAIFGCGPKGLYALDSLCEKRRGVNAEHRFRPSYLLRRQRIPVRGRSYDPRQAEVHADEFPRLGLINAFGLVARPVVFGMGGLVAYPPLDARDYAATAPMWRRICSGVLKRVFVAQAPRMEGLIRHKNARPMR